ncbi:MAG: hypothetical protein JKY65_28190 [Planctomycetes bacterium]|nr:hypothetical protein [Planctomycetota bacterium]
MDRRIRAAARGAGEGDLESMIQLALARRRADPHRKRLTEGDLVKGPALAQALREALAATGKREIELLREATSVPERQQGCWIEALRDLIAGRTRSWCWAERWLPLLGIDDARFWSSLAEQVQAPRRPPARRLKPSPPYRGGFFGAMGRQGRERTS